MMLVGRFGRLVVLYNPLSLLLVYPSSKMKLFKRKRGKIAAQNTHEINHQFKYLIGKLSESKDWHFDKRETGENDNVQPTDR